jgi:hypothetical protein
MQDKIFSPSYNKVNNKAVSQTHFHDSKLINSCSFFYTLSVLFVEIQTFLQLNNSIIILQY